LGNPGASYEYTRHNAGFRVVEALAAAEGIRIRSGWRGSRVGRGRIGVFPVLLVLPQTYMNASGEAILALCKKNGIDPQEVLVVSDDIDLPLGTLRMRARGSAGGQKGIASVISALGTDEFPRLRLGIRGDRYSRERDLADYVLEPFGEAEREIFEGAVGRAIEALRIWLADGTDAAIKSANSKPSSPAPASGPD
jgi:PTH1 family peptidyl-tRNA hydrolase